jgi:hypothetical protein
VHTLSSAAPASSTAALAGLVPLENKADGKKIEKTQSQESIPGAFPMTPPAETPGTEQQMFNISPIPATQGLGNPIQLAPEEHVPAPSTLTDNTVQSTVNLDKLPEDENEAKVSVAPIPATAGAGNPIKLAPGEPVPHPSTLTSNTIDSTARTDPASYEKSSALPPQLGPVDITPLAERDANGGMFALPAQLDNLVPESSLPMGVDALVEKDTGIHMQSAAPLSSTAALAAQVPKEPRGVPEVVTDSQKEAGVAPEAASNAEAVLDKKEVEQELKETVPEQAPVADGSATEAPTTSPTSNVDIGSSLGAVGGAVAAGATVGAGLFAGAIYSAKESAAEAVGLPKDATVAETALAAKDKAVDAVGLDSSATATDNAVLAKDKTLDAVGLDKTATASDNAVLAKDKTLDAVGLDKTATASDNAILAKDKTLDAVGLDKTATATDNAILAKDKTVDAVGLDSSKTPTDNSASPEAAADVPIVVAESQKEAHTSPEAAANAEAVTEKSQVEQELLSEVQKTRATGESAPAVGVPTLVSDSQREAHVSPEASSNIFAVGDKKDVESELLNSIPKTSESGEPAPVITASTSATAPGSKVEDVASGVPEIVAESQKEAHVSPEAAANTEAVVEKKEVESELLKAVPATNESGEPAPVASASQITTAPGAKTELPVREVPDVVAESQKEAHVGPEAAANSEAVAEKKQVESELLNEVEKVNASGEPAPAVAAVAAPGTSEYKPIEFTPIEDLKTHTHPEGLNASAATPAQTEATKTAAAESTPEPVTDGLNASAAAPAQTEATKAAAEPAKDGLFKPTTLEQSQPTVTTGTETTKVDGQTGLAPTEADQTQRKDSDVSPRGTPGSPSVASGVDDKKKKRRSFFGKLKDKLSGKH